MDKFAKQNEVRYLSENYVSICGGDMGRKLLLLLGEVCLGLGGDMSECQSENKAMRIVLGLNRSQQRS